MKNISKRQIAILLTCSMLLVALFVVIMGFRTKTINYDKATASLYELTTSQERQYQLNKTYKVPDTLSFAGERVPLENFDTRESLER